MGFWKCFIYLAMVGVVGFVLGRVLPKDWFPWERLPWKSCAFERNGEIYHKIGIRYWHNRIPDMSRILPGLMPPKKITKKPDMDTLVIMLRETCVAELIHVLLCLSGVYCIVLWAGAGGLVIAVLNVLGNLPFILVQRYNRPRLAKLLKRCKRGMDTEMKIQWGGNHECIDSQLQYGRRS